MTTERSRDPATHTIIGAAIEVHRELGPGLLESAYEACLCQELTERGIPFVRQQALPVRYKGLLLDAGYRLDLVVQEEVVVELKAVETLTGVHEAQILSYLKLSPYRKGLLINFNVQRLADGVRRMIMS